MAVIYFEDFGRQPDHDRSDWDVFGDNGPNPRVTIVGIDPQKRYKNCSRKYRLPLEA